MKKNILTFFSAVVMSSLLTSCAITFPVDVTNQPVGSKTGKSTSTVIFGTIFTNGNYGIQDAAKNGGIKGGVSTVDEKTTNYVIFYKKELIVTGE